MTIEKILAQQIGCLPYVEKVILYGSRARGDAMPTADIDLAVVCPDADDEAWFLIQAMQQAPITLAPIDIRRYDRLRGAIRAAVDAEGKVLYDRSAA